MGYCCAGLRRKRRLNDMKIFSSGRDAVYMIGGGGIGLSHPTDCHTYVLVSGDEAALIDAGSGVRPELMQANLEADGLEAHRITQILVTHCHWDHGRGCACWKRFTGAKLFSHALGVETLENKLWPDSHVERHGAVSEPVKVDRTFADGDKLHVGELVLDVLHTPGHSEDACCFVTQIGDRKILFGGDTVFAEGRHGTITADCDLRAYRDSVKRLSSMKIDALMPGHQQFVLSRAFDHIGLLERKMSGRWTDVTATRVPFFPTWWMEYDNALYQDAL
jgi:glyoxylase-like metal-dependent hydrolase (beta-lactamase superfamily II)